MENIENTEPLENESATITGDCGCNHDDEVIIEMEREGNTISYSGSYNGIEFSGEGKFDVNDVDGSFDRIVSEFESHGSGMNAEALNKIRAKLISELSKFGVQFARGGNTAWYKEAVQAKAPYNLGGWRKELPAEKRRKLALRSRDGKLTREHKYLSAWRALQALANVTTDPATKNAAEADAKYFSSRYYGTKMENGGMVKKSDFDYESFVNYIYAFYGKNGIYASEFGGGASDAEIKSAVDQYLNSVDASTFGGGDSLDRERVRDIMLNKREDSVGNSIYGNGGSTGKVPAWKVYLDKYESFEVGTPVVYHTTNYKGEPIEESGEVVLRNGVKKISLYSDKNYSGSSERVIEPNWNNVETFHEASKRGDKKFKINPMTFGKGGSLKTENMSNLEIQIETVNKAIASPHTSPATKAILEGTKKKLHAKLESEKVAAREADRAAKKSAKIEAKRAELKKKQMEHGRHLKHTTKKPVKRRVKKASAKKKVAPVKKKVVKKGKFHGLPKKVKKFNKGRSASDLRRDKNRDALPKGKRIARKGWMNQYGASKGKGVYYENRPGHSDISKKHSLGEGGNV